ncbi:MAG: hypothetical protein JXQ27_18060 [Acidobacteria bacterium]|nr:hypothetical protein [Acidobacteriota bacterium]
MNRGCLCLLVLSLLWPGGWLAADGSESAQVSVQPWNGFWWPLVDGGMATGAARRRSEPEPVYYSDWERFFGPYDKYHFAFADTPRGDLWQWEMRHHYDPDALSWWGHCNGWAAAAVAEVEPTAPGELNGIYFRVGDKKALLTELHQGDGSRILFHSDEDGAHIFHQTLVQYIRDMDKALVVEIDQSEEVWNFPVFGYEMTWTDDGDTRHVATVLRLGIDSVAPDSTGTSFMTAEFQYDLELSGGDIVGGSWSGASHPQLLWDTVIRQAGNPHLDVDRVFTIVDSVLPAAKNGMADDGLEENDTPAAAAPLDGDVFLGRLLDDDFFSIPVEAGEQVDVAFYNQKIDADSQAILRHGSGEEITARVVEADRILMQAGTQTEDDTFLLELRAVAPQTNRRNYGLEVLRTGQSYYMPHLVNADGWQTWLALYNPTTVDDDLYYHFYHTEPGLVEKQQYTAQWPDLPAHWLVTGELAAFFPDITTENERWLKINTQQNLEGVFIFEHAQMGGNLASMPLLAEGARELYFNHLAVDDIWWTGVSIANTDPYLPAQVTLQPYHKDDASPLWETVSFEIPGGGRFINMLGAMFTPGTLAQAGWIEITADRDVVGFELFGTNDLALFEGIPLQHAKAKSLIAPWTPLTEGYWTGISLVNPSGGGTQVTVTPLNKRGSNAYGAFNPAELSFQLNAKEKYVNNVYSMFIDEFGEPPFGPIAYVSISSYREITGFVLYGDGAEIMCGYPLLTLEDARSAGRFAWLDGLALVVNAKPAGNRVYVTLEAYDAADNLLATGQSPEEIWIGSVHRLDPEEIWGAVPPGIAYLRWSSPQPLLVLGEVNQGTQATVIHSLSD